MRILKASDIALSQNAGNPRDKDYVSVEDVIKLIEEFIDDDTLNHWPPQTTLERLLGEFE